jgi:AraC-like DNA-binding protein
MIDGYSFQGGLAMLPQTLWGADAFSSRSTELTPIAVNRYISPRTAKHFDSHTFWELTCVCRGQGAIRTDAPHAVRRGTLFLIPPNMEHCEHADESIDTIWIALSGSRLAGLNPATLYLAHIPELQGTAERLWQLAGRARPGTGSDLDALAATIVSQLVRHVRDETPAGITCVERAIEWMHRHFDAEISVKGLAERFECSEGYFHRTFRRHTGQTPVAFLTAIRLKHALHAMTYTTAPIGDIARSVGFTDPLYFSRVFRQATGYSPRRFRAAQALRTRETPSASG